MSPLITALIVGGIAAGAAGLAHDIKGFVEGKTPWDDPLEWTKGHAISAGTGFVGGAAGSALGPALGAMGEMIGIGTNVGTEAAAAGAATSTEVAGVVNPAASQLLTQAGTNATEVTIGNVAKQVIGRTGMGALTGAATNPRNPGQGALIGGAGALASAGIQAGAGIGFRGAGASFVDNAPTDPTRGFSLSSGEFGRAGAYNPSASYGLQVEPRMGAVGQGIVRAGGGVASDVTGTSLQRAMAPRPAMNPNPYSGTPYGLKPYWANRMM